MTNYAAWEVYRVVCEGDTLAHVTNLFGAAKPLHVGCPLCERFRRAVALAEYHKIEEAA